ncbi:MAG: hypothetical protein O2877_01965 [bacterium]|nr:hypothetical protein [bacterium]
MSPRIKKILVAIGFTVIVIILASAVYIVFFRVSPGVQEFIEVEEGTEGLPSAGDGGPRVVTPPTPSGGIELPRVSEIAVGGLTEVTTLTTSAVTAPTLSTGNTIAFFDETDSRFYRITADGEIKRISDQRFAGLSDTTWNKDGNKAVLEFPDGANIIYDFDSATQVTLPSHWDDFEFSPRADQVISKSIGIDPNNRSLVITNADGTNTRSIANLGKNASKVELSWSPNDQVVGFSDTGPTLTGEFGRRMMIPIGKKDENFKGLVVEGFNFKSSWSPQGDTVVYSTVGSANDYRPGLWATDGRPNTLGDNRRNLGINTWIEKCTFADNSTLYCAVPKQLPANSGLQPAIADDIADDIFRININTGQSELVAVPETPVSIEQMIVSEDGDSLFFMNADSGLLQQIRLK